MTTEQKANEIFNMLNNYMNGDKERMYNFVNKFPTNTKEDKEISAKLINMLFAA